MSFLELHRIVILENNVDDTGSYESLHKIKIMRYCLDMDKILPKTADVASCASYLAGLAKYPKDS